MSTPEEVIKLMQDKEVAFVDFRFTDTLGREHHMTVPAHAVDEEKLESGQAFDGS
ncbi:MAG TPA: glutamine synthetase, partial [Pusillimonas sp.]|nr:glutamine synthetase [Pusillimonas sp.]